MIAYLFYFVIGLAAGLIIAKFLWGGLKVKFLEHEIEEVADEVLETLDKLESPRLTKAIVKEGLVEVITNDPLMIHAYAEAAVNKRKVCTTTQDGTLVTFVPSVMELKVKAPCRPIKKEGSQCYS